MLCNALWHKVSQSSNIQAKAPGRPRLSTVDPLYCISRCHSLVTECIPSAAGNSGCTSSVTTHWHLHICFAVNKLVSHPKNESQGHAIRHNARKFSWKQTKPKYVQGLPTANLEGDKALVLQLSSHLKALLKTFLSCHMGGGLIHSQAHFPGSTSGTAIVQVQENPPKNMWNSHCYCKIQRATHSSHLIRISAFLDPAPLSLVMTQSVPELTRYF